MENLLGWVILAAFGLIALGWVLEKVGDGIDKVAGAVEKNKAIEVDEQIESARAAIKESEKNLAELAASSSYRNLNLDGLIIKGLEPFGEMLNSIRDEMDPLVRLLICYMFIEELSENYSEEKSSIAEFSYSFLKEELGDDDFNSNFDGSEIGEGYFETPIFWGNVIQSRIEESYIQVQNDDAEHLKSSLCASFCAELSEGIDSELIDRFIEKAKGSLQENGMLTSGAQSTFLSLAL